MQHDVDTWTVPYEKRDVIFSGDPQLATPMNTNIVIYLGELYMYTIHIHSW